MLAEQQLKLSFRKLSTSELFSLQHTGQWINVVPWSVRPRPPNTTPLMCEQLRHRIQPDIRIIQATVAAMRPA